MEKKRVLFLSADFGAGHNSAMSAFKQALDKHYPNKFEYATVDVGALIGPNIDKVAEFLYKGMTMYAKLSYKAYFKLTNSAEYKDIDNNYYPLLKSSFKQISDQKPDLLIFCFPLLFTSISRYLKEKNINIPIVTLITDTGKVHINWVCDKVDYYLAPTKDTGFYLEERGIKPEKVKVLGFPVRQQFYKRFDVPAVKEKMGISPEKKVIIIFAGAWGSGKIKRKVDELDTCLKDTVILVVCGRNRTLKSRIKHSGYRRNKVMTVGFVDNIAEIISVADVVVAKAGGISVMELLTMKKPIVVTEIFPGQEEPNAKFIESMGFGYIEKDPENMAKRVKFMLETDDLDRIHDNYSRYHLNEHSDKHIADFIDSILHKDEETVENKELVKSAK